MTDADRLPDPSAAIQKLPAHSAVIVRHYQAPEREALVRRIIGLCRTRGVLVFVAGDPALARSTGADGLHLPETMMFGNPGAWRRDWPLGKPVSAAAHSLKALMRAGRIGADFALVSPVFQTRSHPGVRVLGLPRFSTLVRHSPVPVYGLGGVTVKNAERVLAAGAAGWAAIDGLIV